MNYVNYAKHKLYEPESYHRRYDLDLKSEDSKPGLEDQVKRIALISLPFLSLCRPLGSVISLGMGSARIIFHLRSAIEAGNWKNCTKEFFYTAIAILSLASSIFNFTLGLAISTSIDIGQSLVRIIQALREKKYEKAAEEILQMLTSLTYLAFMIQGSLELMVAFALLQTICSFYQAHLEMGGNEPRILEAAAKVALGIIRLHQAGVYVKQIERKNQLLKLEKLASFVRRSLRGRDDRHLIENPLNDLKGKDPTTLTNSENQEFDFGSYIHGYGKSLVKGANLNIRTIHVKGDEKTEIDFKINHVFRNKIQTLCEELSSLSSTEIEDVLKLTQSHAKGIHIENNQPFPIGNQTKGQCQKITFEGLGSLFIGSSPNMPTLYNRIVVQMDAGKSIYDFHELMSFLDLDLALLESSAADLERLKMGHLWRTFFPRDATPFERTEEFFFLPLDQLKAKIVEKTPEMEEIFATYLDKMVPIEMIGGKVRYRIQGLKGLAEQAGAKALTAAITGAYSEKELFSRIASIIKMGMISTEMKAQGHMGVKGLSPDTDFYSGGADSVFTQMITETNCKENMPFSHLHYNGKARFIISTDVLETGTYQYYTDSFGNRKMDSSFWGSRYQDRSGTIEFAERMQHPFSTKWGYSFGGNEVMIKDRIDPSFFKGIILNNQQTKDELMNYLRAHDLVQSDIHGNETILNRAADTFLRVGTHITEEILA